MIQILLHEAVDLEPVGPAAIAGTRLGHANHEAFSEATSLASGPVLFVHNTGVVVFTLLDDRLVVACTSKEGFASLAGEGSKVESSGWLIAHPAELVLHGIQAVKLQRKCRE